MEKRVEIFFRPWSTPFTKTDKSAIRTGRVRTSEIYFILSMLLQQDYEGDHVPWEDKYMFNVRKLLQ